MIAKYFIFSLLLITFNVSYTQEKTFSINGELSNLSSNEFVYLLKGEYPLMDKTKWLIEDSTIQKNGMFSFKLSISKPDFYMIVLLGNRWCTFIAEPDKNILVKGDAQNLLFASVTGSLNNHLYKSLINKQEPLVQKMNKYADSSDFALDKHDSILYKKFLRLNQVFANKIKLINIRTIKIYPKSFVALNEMRYYYTDFTKKKVIDFLNQLPKNLKNHPISKEIYYNKIQKEIDIKNISKFYNAKLFDTLLNKINFNSYLGKIVLLDFWASWCKPCLSNIPFLKKIYSKYKTKKFDIISVSLDDNLDNWKNGINSNPVEWKNMSDLKGWQGPLIKYLKIESIPRYSLLDVDGKMIISDIKLENIDNVIFRYLDTHKN